MKTEAETIRPNILWICTDQQRFDTIGSLGNPHIRTPNIDRLVSEGVSFTNAYCQSPVCTPSRASFLTGMYPSAVGVNGNGVPTFPPHYTDRLVPRRLADAGYECGLVGKLHISSAYKGREKRLNDGYETFHYSHSSRGPTLPGNDYTEWLVEQGYDPAELMESQVGKNGYRGGEFRNRGGLAIPTAERDNAPQHLHQTHWCVEKSIDFLSQAHDRPWMLSINFFDPHPPFNAPWDYYKRYDPEKLPGAHFRQSDISYQSKLESHGVDFQTPPRDPESFNHREIQASYYGMIELIDDEIGRLLRYLEEKGLRNNTIIIFTSDHGEALGDHGLLMKGCRFMEGSVHVPLVISWPGHFREGLVSEAFVELIDIAPTLYDLAGIDTPYYVQGRSLTTLLTGQRVDHRKFARCEAIGCIDFPDQTRATMYRDERWKLVTYHGKNLFELYDLENDPWEHEDLSEDPAFLDVKNGLIQASFDATIAAVPEQTPRVAPY